MEETKNVAGVDLDELRKAREELNRERGIETPPPETYDRPKREPVEEPVESAPVAAPVEPVSQESSDVVSTDLTLDDLLNELMMDSKFDEYLANNLAEAENNAVQPAQPVVAQQPAPVQPVQEPIVANEDDEVFGNFAAFDLGGNSAPVNPVQEQPQSVAEPPKEGEIANTEFKFDESKDYSLDELYQAVIGKPYEKEETADETVENAEPTIEQVVSYESEKEDDDADIDDVFAKFDSFAVASEEQPVQPAVEPEPIAEVQNVEPEPVVEPEIPVEPVAENNFESLEEISENDVQETEIEEIDPMEDDSFESEIPEVSQAVEESEPATAVQFNEESEIPGASQVEDMGEIPGMSQYQIVDDAPASPQIPMVESSAEELTNINGLQEIYVENTPSNHDDSSFEMIGSFRQLEELLGSEEEAQEILETINEEVFQEEQESEEEVAEPVKSKYNHIEPFRYVDLITTDSFKNSNNLSYIIGKNEEGNIVYGNLIDSYNVALFGRESDELHNLVHSILLSLILKNPVSDINFVICDSKSDSKFEVYNKSSYMYFNRIAKTNKEILDSLIELSKELEERYKLFAEIGVKSIEQYNIIAKNDNLKHLPYLLTVFNNYSKSIQLTNSDKINACLYQLLKYGRMVGIYIMIVANTAITSDEINYNLPTRISFKTDDVNRSLTTLGFAGAEALPSNEDMLYSSLLSESLTHLKVAMLTTPEIELLIENIED